MTIIYILCRIIFFVFEEEKILLYEYFGVDLYFTVIDMLWGEE